MNLTVAIPTYNRNAILHKNIQALLPQLTGKAKLLILDNCSPIPAEETLAPLIDAYPDLECRIVRHAANVGGDQNILRCLELSQTDWIWMLGDDDIVLPDALDTVLAEIEAHPDALLINFFEPEAGHSRPETFVTAGLDDFVDKVDSMQNIIFISTCVYNATRLRSELAIANHFTYSQSSQLVVVLASLGTSGKCCFSKHPVVTWGGPITAVPTGTSIRLYLGVSALLELPMSGTTRQKMAKKLIVDWMPADARFYLFRKLLEVERNPRQRADVCYLYRQLRLRLACHTPNPAIAVEFWLYWLMLRFPTLPLFAVDLVHRVKNRNSPRIERSIQRL